MDTSTKLVAMTEDDECFDQIQYQSAIGSLLYLAVATRPDIAFAVSNVAKLSARPMSGTVSPWHQSVGPGLHPTGHW